MVRGDVGQAVAEFVTAMLRERHWAASPAGYEADDLANAHDEVVQAQVDGEVGLVLVAAAARGVMLANAVRG